MDKKDEKILIELIKNSRIPFKQLGKKVGLSREVVAYRVNKFIEEKIITNFHSIVNVGKLGYSRNGCWIQLKELDEDKEKKFFSFLKRHPFVTYAGSVVGKWNVAFDILSKDKENLKKTVMEITEEVGRHLQNIVVTNNSSQEEIYPTKILGINEREKAVQEDKKIKLDNIDKKILELLSEDSRTDYVELSSKTNVSANTVKYRIKQLEKSGIIEGHTISIDITKLGYEFYNLQIKLGAVTNEHQIKSFLRSNPNITYFYKYFGHENWDMDIGIIAKNSRELREIITDFRNNIGKIMIIHDIYHTLEIIKANVASKGIFE